MVRIKDLEAAEARMPRLHTYMVQRHWMMIGTPIRFSDGEKVIAVLSAEPADEPGTMYVTVFVEMP
jgi:hypothetical protein